MSLTMLIAISFFTGFLTGLIIKWLNAQDDIAFMEGRIQQLEKELMEYVKKDIQKELRDE